MTGASIHTCSFCITGVDDTAHCHGGGSDRRWQVRHPADFGSLADQDGQAHHHERPQPKGERIVSAALATQLNLHACILYQQADSWILDMAAA